MPGSTFSITLGRMEASIYTFQAPVFIGVVYQFEVEGMRARKHVQYHFGADGSKHV